MAVCLHHQTTKQTLKNKIEVFERYFHTHKQVNLVLITSNGLKPSIWSEELIDQVLDLHDLFKSIV